MHNCGDFFVAFLLSWDHSAINGNTEPRFDSLARGVSYKLSAIGLAFNIFCATKCLGPILANCSFGWLSITTSLERLIAIFMGLVSRHFIISHLEKNREKVEGTSPQRITH